MTSEIDQNGDHVPAEAVVRREIWAEPLTQSERQIIENVLREGNASELHRWLTHSLRIFDAQQAFFGS